MLGMGIALPAAYGFLTLSIPHISLLIAVLLLSQPKPLPLLKSAVLAVLLMLLTGIGVLLVPLLENYAFTAVLLIAVVLFILFYWGNRNANPLLNILVLSFTLIPVAGVQEQAVATAVIQALAAGVLLGSFSGFIAFTIFPDVQVSEKKPQPAPDAEAAGWIAIRGVVIVLPVLILALQNPAFYMAAIMKTTVLSQQAGTLSAKQAGRELVGSTFLGALLAMLVWAGLTLWPSLWMFSLWIMLVSGWLAQRLYRLCSSAYPPSFWMNVLITLLIFIGPAVQDSANGNDVYRAAAIRLALFTAIALYAWAAIYGLEFTRTRLRPARALLRGI
jgi:hypothetical protein